jgi:hypothetical protein
VAKCLEYIDATEEKMVAHVKNKFQIESRAETLIEDLGNHPAELVMALQRLLEGGATIIPDPKRTGFYEVESDALVYYIHVLPITGKILLLTTWPNQAALGDEERAA